MQGHLMSFTRPQAAVLTRRLRETRRFIQAIAGPRQVGKTTLVRQVVEGLHIAARFASADEPTLRGRDWIEQQWQAARVEAGDALFIPKRNWHAVVAQEPSISLAVFGLTFWEIISRGGPLEVRQFLHKLHLYRWGNCICHKTPAPSSKLRSDDVRTLKRGAVDGVTTH